MVEKRREEKRREEMKRKVHTYPMPLLI